MSMQRALPAPQEAVVILGRTLVERALAASRRSERGRVILPLHKSHEDPLHRMFNALQPGTYVRPHRHLSTSKSESFIVLRGALDFLVFNEQGRIALARRLEAGGESFGIDVAPRCFHSFLVREPDTLLFEVKPGPYSASDDKDFAAWAPPEGASEVAAYLVKLEEALTAYTRAS